MVGIPFHIACSAKHMEVTRYIGSHLDDILTNCRLKVSKVSQFNDPFELRYKCVGEFTRKEAESFVQERLDRKGFIQLLGNMNEFRGKNEREIKHHYEENKTEIADKILDLIPDAHRKLIDGTAKKADEIVRVICFSKPTQKPLEEILLWSHYARSHSGCRIWINLSVEPLLAINSKEVTYSDKLVSLDISDPNVEQNAMPVLKKAMVTKAKCWDYEDEIRVFIHKKLCKSEKVSGVILEYIDISLVSLTRIDFGIRFPKEERNTLIESLKKDGLSNTKFFQCRLSYDKYAIEYEEL